jgi:hypothetical protein
MNWIEKINYLIQCEKNNTEDDIYTYDIFFRGNFWTNDEINALIKNYKWLPSSYLNFIRQYDGICISFVDFYASKGRNFSKLESYLNDCEVFLKGNYFPFAKDADGSQFIFDKEGKVYWWDSYDYDFEQEPKFIANSLEEFVDDCLLGKRYKEFNFIENNRFYNFLKSMGWTE